MGTVVPGCSNWAWNKEAKAVRENDTERRGRILGHVWYQVNNAYSDFAAIILISPSPKPPIFLLPEFSDCPKSLGWPATF